MPATDTPQIRLGQLGLQISLYDSMVTMDRLARQAGPAEGPVAQILRPLATVTGLQARSRARFGQATTTFRAQVQRATDEAVAATLIGSPDATATRFRLRAEEKALAERGETVTALRSLSAGLESLGTDSAHFADRVHNRHHIAAIAGGMYGLPTPLPTENRDMADDASALVRRSARLLEKLEAAPVQALAKLYGQALPLEGLRAAVQDAATANTGGLKTIDATGTALGKLQAALAPLQAPVAAVTAAVESTQRNASWLHEQEILGRLKAAQKTVVGRPAMLIAEILDSRDLLARVAPLPGLEPVAAAPAAPQRKAAAPRPL